MRVEESKPVPGGGRPRPKKTVKTVKKMMVKALYDYDAQENDEISIQAGVTFELVREGEIQVNLSAVKMNILQTTPLVGGQALLMDKKDSSLEIMWRKSD